MIYSCSDIGIWINGWNWTCIWPDHIAAVGTQLFKRKSKKKRKNKPSKINLYKIIPCRCFLGRRPHHNSCSYWMYFIFFFTINIQSEIFSGFELMVGAMLILLGILLSGKKLRFQHRHPHQHSDGILHYDAHEHNDIDHKHDQIISDWSNSWTCWKWKFDSSDCRNAW